MVDKIIDEGDTLVNGAVKTDQGSVEVMYVRDNKLKMNFVRVRFRSKAPRLMHIIGFLDIPADLPSGELELKVARAGGALCERHCEKYMEVIDPSEAAAAAVEGLRLLKKQVRGDQPSKLIV